MKKIATLSLLMSPLLAQAETLNVFNWYDYLPQESITQFQEKYGIDVNYDVYESNEMLEAKLMTGKSGYDVVVPSGSFLERQQASGIYLPIDKSKIENYPNLNTKLLKKVAEYDPGNQYGVPYAWGTIGIGYNVEMLKERLGDMPINSLDLLFNPEYTRKLEDCGIAAIDSPAEVMAILFNYLGLDPNSEKSADLKKAAAAFKQVRGNYKYFNTGNYLSDLASGDICIALGYNGGVLQAKFQAAENGRVIEYAIPKEGTAIWFDLMAIPADAPNPEAAHKFISHILDPQVGAGISNLVYYAVPNTKAPQFINKEIIENPSIYPSEEVIDTLFIQRMHTAKFDRILNRAWTNIKAER
ncbi:MAG: polyamine ABC transporter substrate-binding protein [Amphritea sp.]|nr:polyamine ABC transporter substrate-binding protein [Amphritea sp.]